MELTLLLLVLISIISIISITFVLLLLVSLLLLMLFEELDCMWHWVIFEMDLVSKFSFWIGTVKLSILQRMSGMLLKPTIVFWWTIVWLLHIAVLVSCLHTVQANFSTKFQGSYRSWKTWKVQPGILFWHFPWKRPLVLESSGNLLNSTKKYEVYGR